MTAQLRQRNGSQRAIAPDKPLRRWPPAYAQLACFPTVRRSRHHAEMKAGLRLPPAAVSHARHRRADEIRLSGDVRDRRLSIFCSTTDVWCCPLLDAVMPECTFLSLPGPNPSPTPSLCICHSWFKKASSISSSISSCQLPSVRLHPAFGSRLRALRSLRRPTTSSTAQTCLAPTLQRLSDPVPVALRPCALADILLLRHQVL
jgi:hypothetical protein